MNARIATNPGKQNASLPEYHKAFYNQKKLLETSLPRGALEFFLVPLTCFVERKNPAFCLGDLKKIFSKLARKQTNLR
jgi:hypothetical protein